MSCNQSNPKNPSAYSPDIGRFAPSPTGDLHFGSLVAALASFLDARNANGLWLLRVEDLDPPREVRGSAAAIIRDLEHWGMTPDIAILYQSQRAAAYQATCDQLIKQDLAYWCGCSRSELPESGIYPGTCSAGLAKRKRPRALRLRTLDRTITFEDRIQGRILHDLTRQSGDFVIRRADGYFAYQLAVVVDDAFQQVTDIVRGADLLESTPRQIWLQQCLGLPTPRYTHIPVITGKDGQKLSKRLKSDPVRLTDPLHSLRLALRFLRHKAPLLDLADTLQWAMEHWNLNRLPRVRTLSIDSPE